MRFLLISFLIACGGAETPHAVPPKPPNNELINGEYERHPPDGTAAMRLRADGSFRIAKNKADLDKDPAIVEGHYTLEKDTLTLNAEKGACAKDELSKSSIYKVVLSKVGIRFTKETETCTERATMDNTTWFRSK
ncbi:MAG TPA: hypothetical protein VGM88_12725 [Kofleriaceae bacterium]|jgi:hypothetical protein